ncbi:MAG: 3-isopropylmalate dehydrogenase [candidate division NC10 bacterium]|nr:3-isopropylmalate dehydrogenase [candidate division NC10 bacterium]
MGIPIAVLKGDGIGPEVVDQALRVLREAAGRFDLALTFREGLLGGAAVDATGDPLPEETLALCRNSRAILLGAVGGPKWDGLAPEVRPERGILRLRAALGLYANLRPARLSPALIKASTLKREAVEGTDLVVVRELTGGLYFGTPRGIERGPDGERAVDTLTYTTGEIVRIARVAFEVAAGRRKKVTSVDKANVLASSLLWRRVVEEVHREFPGVALEHMYVDTCAMQLIRSPRAFDVILTENMFGDILSDEAAMLTGSIGMLPSASLGAEVALYEPIHGTAPDLAGKDVANPIGAVLSAALCCRYSLRREDVAAAIERAVEGVLAAGWRTADLARPGERTIGTAEMGRRLAEAVTAG